MTAQAITYAIGDVHGRSDLLATALEHVRSLTREDGLARRVEFLGDIIDRGPDSRGAMELVHGALAEFEGSILHLGNHDQWFLEAIDATDERMISESWLVNGGIQTLLSYDADIMGALDTVRDGHPHHVAMLRAASIMTNVGPFALVHAGIAFELPIADQDPDDLLWIRSGFLDEVGIFERPIVHGHTIMGDTPVVTENRISIDTGAYRTDCLTMLEIDLEGESLRFLRAGPDGVTPVAPILLDRGHGTVLERLPELFAEASEESRPANAA
jgi:serine/threonine protein phosphatase 1